MASVRPRREPPPAALARILDTPPPLAPVRLRGGTQLTPRWGHGPLHDFLPTMRGHALVTYYGQPQHIAWTLGRERLAAQTLTGTITIIPGTHEGYWDIAGPIGVSHVFLTDERIQQWSDEFAAARRLTLHGRVGHADAVAAQLMHVLSDEAVSDEPASRLFVEQATDLLCTQVLRRHSSLGDVAVVAARRGLAAWQVRRVVAYARERLAEDLGLDELARVLGLSRYHFCTAFRLATGHTPHAMLMRLRMERARELLLHPGLRVLDVGVAVGYQTSPAFTAAFRRCFGMTPSQFRRSR